MIELIGVHRPDQTDVVDARAEFGQQFADFDSGFTTGVELVRCSQQLGPARFQVDEGQPLLLQYLQQFVRTGLHVVLDQRRLVVEQILLRRGAGHVQIDHMLGLGRFRGGLGGERVFPFRASLSPSQTRLKTP